MSAPPSTSAILTAPRTKPTTRRQLATSARRDPLILISLIWLLLIAAAIVLRDVVLPSDYQDAALANRLLPPLSTDADGAFYLFGTDSLGRDYLTQLIAGTTATVLPAVAAIIVGFVLGIAIGSTAGFIGGRVDAGLLRVMEFQVVFPPLLLALLVLTSVGPSVWVLVIVLALGSWVGLARVSRGMALELRELSFVDAARVIGSSRAQIISRHIAPNLLTPLLVLGTLEFAGLLLASAGLDFLGLGVQPPETSWGLLVAKGRESITTAWWLVAIPGLTIFMTTLAVNIVALWLRDNLDLEQKSRILARSHAKRSATFAQEEPVPPQTTNAASAVHASAVPASAILHVDDLWVEFATDRGVAKAVRGVSWGVAPGEVLAVVGESGSGKSVTARAVMNVLERPQSHVRRGAIWYDGVDLIGLDDNRRRKILGNEIALVQQDALAALNPTMTIGAHLVEVIRNHQHGVTKKAARARAIELLTQVGIPDPAGRVDDFPHQFSGGMRQRVLIAMAIANSPKVLIADEPTTALDVTVQAQIVTLLLELRARTGMSIVLITHDLSLVSEAADRVVVMYAGRVMETGAVRDVVDRPAHPYTRQLLASTPDVAAPRGRLTPIPGTPPSAVRLPSGCPFNPRCELAQDICRELRPPEHVVAIGRTSACHFAEEVVGHRD